jgi:hypothetical protein
MDLIMFHSHRPELPDYLEDNLKQIRLFNPDINIHFLTDKVHKYNPLFKKYNVLGVNKDEFYSDKITRFTLYFNYFRKPQGFQFWVITATRLMYIEKYIKECGLTDVYHFENDILLYCDLRTIHDTILKLYKSLAITVGGPDKCMTGLMFIKDSTSLAVLTQFFLDKLRIQGKAGIVKSYGMDMVNEMTLMRAFSKDYPDRLEFLPILPFGEYSNNYSYFNSIFDPASWGMFVGGNAQEKEPGCKPKDHYIGQLLEEHPEYNVIWKKDQENRNIPYFKYNGSEIKINNLHIHCKDLYKYISK